MKTKCVNMNMNVTWMKERTRRQKNAKDITVCENFCGNKLELPQLRKSKFVNFPEIEE